VKDEHWRTLIWSITVGLLVFSGNYGPAACIFMLWLDLRLDE
jgi:hypothetical protein